MKKLPAVLIFISISLSGIGQDKSLFLVEKATNTDSLHSGITVTDDEILSFLARAEAALSGTLPLDEDLLAEFQNMTQDFDRIVAEESPQIAEHFFGVSEKMVLREKEATALTVELYKKRKKADRLSGKLAAASLGAAAAGGVFFAAATVPYNEYVNAYETAEAVEARKKTVGVLVPAGLFTAAAGGLLISSVAIFGTGRQPEPKNSRLRETAERYRGSYLRRGGF